MKKMPEKQKSKKKKPKKQNPYFSFFTSFPGGTPYKNPDSTLLRGLDMGADGPPGSPLEITHTHNGILKVLTPPGSVFNPSGRFLLQVLNLFDGSHTFGLRANSSSSPFHEWLLNVGAVEKLTIDSLKGLNSGVEIPSGTSTSEKLFALSGQARANATVDLYDNDILVAGPIAVGALGNWTYNTGPQAQGPHRYTVRGKYDSGPESAPPRTLTILGLAIDPTPMILDGVMVINGYGWSTNEMPGNTATRVPTTGVLPFTYQPADPTIVQVSNLGKVVGIKNGSTTVTVTDATGQSASYPVQVSKVYRLLINNSLLTALEGMAWLMSVGGVNDYNVIAYVGPSLMNPVRDLYENRLYPDPYGSRIYQYLPGQVNVLCWNGSTISGYGILFTGIERARAMTVVPT
ncbi:Ig-like domain-containing protein [Pseudomonas gozinkensis]|uniref:Ig-like domain-containing protein n=1 Tax=Pseudomonas gozinkensis TaxID=2774461 RepID=UPI0017879D8E|nr:Ig-like domain-containing protein [Pseudomonas gozinkensis]